MNELSTFFNTATNSELIIMGIITLASLAILYFVFKIIKYLLMISFLLSGLYFAGVLDSDAIQSFNTKYKISETFKNKLKSFTDKNDATGNLLEQYGLNVDDRTKAALKEYGITLPKGNDPKEKKD
jgi:hypothetical protein